MLSLERHVGESLIVQTPDGPITIIVGATTGHTKATLQVKHAGVTETHNRYVMSHAWGKPLLVKLPGGNVRVEVAEIIPTRRGEGNAKVRLQVDAPREWLILRQELIV